MAESTDSFRAIIIGGGPVALTAALAFDRAGVEYVVLERRSAFDNLGGASLAIYPHNVRLLDQLGLLEAAERTYMPVKYKRNLKRDGSELCRNNMLETIGINHGHPWMCFHRAKLMDMLLHKVKDRSKILLDKEVTAVNETATGVTVTCADGSSYKGSIVIGADGVHSFVRKLISDRAGKPDDAFTASYRGVFGHAPRVPSLDAGTLYEIHSDGITIQMITSEELQLFLVYERLPQTTREAYLRYTPEDQDALLARVADVRFPGAKPGEWVGLGDIWEKKQWSAMDNLQEGIVKGSWHDGRCVLVGDAVHKMTPNIGFGCNSGMQDVAHLVNKLHALLGKTAEPDVAALGKEFREYQAARVSNTKEAVDISGLYTRLVSWNNPVWKFADQYVLPHLNGDILALNIAMAPIVRKGITFDFLEEESFKAGKYAYYKH